MKAIALVDNNDVFLSGESLQSAVAARAAMFRDTTIYIIDRQTYNDVGDLFKQFDLRFVVFSRTLDDKTVAIERVSSALLNYPQAVIVNSHSLLNPLMKLRLVDQVAIRVDDVNTPERQGKLEKFNYYFKGWNWKIKRRSTDLNGRMIGASLVPVVNDKDDYQKITKATIKKKVGEICC